MYNTLLCQQSTHRNFNLTYLKLTLDNWPLSVISDEAVDEIIYDEL